MKWAHHLQDRIRYLTVLNEFNQAGCRFEYWHAEPATQQFTETLSLHFMTMGTRIQEFLVELRNHGTTLQQVIDSDTKVPFFLKSKNLFRAKRYQRQLFQGFEAASDILFP